MSQVHDVRVMGKIPVEVLQEMGVLGLDPEPPLTILRTEPIEQSGLQGPLQQLHSLGLYLLEVRSSPDRDGMEPGEPGERTPWCGASRCGSAR